MQNSYSKDTGTFQAQLEKLHDLIDVKMVRKYHDDGIYWDCDKQARYDARMPKQHKGGENYHLERLRKAKNAYAKFMNGGDKNRIFDDAAERLVGQTYFGYGRTVRVRSSYAEEYAKLVERVLDERIVLASCEQEVM